MAPGGVGWEVHGGGELGVAGVIRNIDEEFDVSFVEIRDLESGDAQGCVGYLTEGGRVGVDVLVAVLQM